MSEEAKKTPAVQWLDVDPGYAGQRIDNFLAARLKGVPKSYIYRILRKGEVRVNKGRVKAAYRLQAGDQIRVPPVRVAERDEPPRAGKRNLDRLQDALLYEDDALIVLNKPSGMAVHGGSGVSLGVIETMRELRPELRQLELVHRLDRDTSGCLMLAKKRSALRLLHELQREGGIQKRYRALLAGAWSRRKADVNQPLRKNTLRGGERIVRVDPEGKPALTHFRRLAVYRDATLVEALLATGRTHQIRVHAAHLGTPILGDAKYGDEEANRRFRELGLKRLFLHAFSLKIRDWQGKELEIEAPLEPALQTLLEELES